MKVSKLPSKLGIEPLVDAVFQVRFPSKVSLAAVLPGFLFKALGDIEQIEHLPASQIPRQQREANPQLAMMTLSRTVWQKRFLLMFGDESVAIACVMPYPGWSAFRAAIEKVLTTARESGSIDSAQRYSMKYANLFDNLWSIEPERLLDWSVSLGPPPFVSRNTMLRAEVSEDAYIHLVSVATQAEAVLSSGERRQGALIDVDTVCSDLGPDGRDFWTSLPDRLNAIRLVNKRKFFECLTEPGLNQLMPQYD